MNTRQSVAIKNSLSQARLSTYEKYNKDLVGTLETYCWNLKISSRLFECLAVCEVTIRNAVAKAIRSIYGDKWAWNNTFLSSLPSHAREILEKKNKKFYTIDKIIPEMPFYFWQTLLTKRFRNSIWQNQLGIAFPNAEYQSITGIWQNLEDLRDLRNRIAHHEPIFNRNLQEDYDKIVKVIGYCCQDTADWLITWQGVTQLLSTKA